MSRIGKQPISIASGVKITLNGRNIKVEGPKARPERTLHHPLHAKLDPDQPPDTPILEPGAYQ